MAERHSPSTTARSGALEASLPRDAYLSHDFFERERHAIFYDQWFYAGRAEHFGCAGAFRVVEVAGESIIIVRADQGLYAHLNLCRHRGSRLLCGDGVLRGAIRCPYHAWAYALDGALVAAPFVAPQDVPLDARHLHPVGVESWNGFVFLHLSPERAREEERSLSAQLGAIPARLCRYPLDELRIGTSLRYEVAANWKVMLENFNECYHCAGVHPELCRVVPAFKHRGGSGLDWERGIPHRDGAWTFTLSGTTNRSPFNGLNADERMRHKGELIYPNFMLSLAADHAAAFCLWPQNAERTVITCDVLFHPSETEKPGFDPSDAVEFWDLINRQDWAICESVQSG
ncbi:MAG: aromatic ring-hydroxylating dioxygenase subunit alpha, partial [Candidatus Eremiobacteraeota bacterium]|nr:aromatic ring-hydroxylating dioxygenase subunit alpha [Candidatus Eremiobacteraeota bacterium]